MNYSDYRFPLDVQMHQAQVSVPVTLGDTARKLCISLTDGRKPYVIAEGCIATFNARKPDGNIIKNSCIIERNTIIYEFTEQTTNIEGVVNCDVTIYGVDGKVLYSPQFILVVDKKVVRDEAIPLSESDLTAFDAIFVREAGRVTAEIERGINEETRQGNETTRQGNEETRQGNEEQRKSDFDEFLSDAQSAFNQAEQERMDIFDEAEAERDKIVGDLNKALDHILAVQESLMGIITFTIGGTLYVALQGMTWREWCDSEYNVSGYYCTDGGDVRNDNEDYVGYESDGAHVYDLDLIIAGTRYVDNL